MKLDYNVTDTQKQMLSATTRSVYGRYAIMATEFVESGLDVAKVERDSNVSTESVRFGFKTAIKRCNLSIRVTVRNDSVYLLKT